MGDPRLELARAIDLDSPIWEYTTAADAVDLLHSAYVEYAYDVNGSDRFLGTIRKLEEDLEMDPLPPSLSDAGSRRPEVLARYNELLLRSLPPAGSPRRMFIDSLAQNYRHMRTDLAVLDREAPIFGSARTIVSHILDARLQSVHSANEELDLLTMAQGWDGQFEVNSRMLWAGLLSLLEHGKEVLIPADVERLIHGVSRFAGIDAWTSYIDDTRNRTGLELDEQDDHAERSEAIRMWLDNFVGNANWESTGHQAARNSLYVMLKEGRAEAARLYLQLEREGLGSSRLWATVHMAASNYRLLDDTLLSIFELMRQDAHSSLGYEMQEYLDVSIALFNTPALLAAIQKYLIPINQKLADRSSSRDLWLRETEGLEFLTDFYQRLLIQNGKQGVDERLLRIFATQDINDIRARLIRDVISLDEADRDSNSKALATLENESFAEMLDTEDPATFPFERYTGLISRRSLPPTTNGAAGANGATNGSTPPPPFAARNARASTVTGLIENTGETIGANLGVAAPLYPGTHRIAQQRAHGAGRTQIAGARAAIQTRLARPVIATTVRPAQIVVR